MDDAVSRVRLLIAPAGYGKTTLAHEWLSLSGRDGAWITATPALADVGSFALAFGHALRKRLPEVDVGLKEWLRVQPSSTANVRSLARHLADGLADWPPDSWLVIDDYQAIMEVPAVEHFVDELVATSRLQVIVAGRRRPTWASARRLIYGDVHEIGQSALAMNFEEASAVLALGRRRHSSGLLALANGWPAIIGLAANADRLGTPADSVPAAVYDFFAQELYQGASRDVRRALVSLSFAPSLTVSLASHLIGGDSRAVLGEGERLGFVHHAGEETYIMHSLIREFLRKQAAREGVAAGPIVAHLTTFLLGCGDLDNLFVLCREFPRNGSTQNATDVALQSLLNSDQGSTIERWVAHALTIGLDSPAVDLAQAELEFREGRYRQAEELAMRGSSRFPMGSSLRSRAMFRAGMAAYHEDRPKHAREQYRLARAAATTTHDRLRALWGELNVVLEANEDLGDLLDAFENEASDTAADKLRLGNARLMAAYRRGGIADAVRDGEALLPLVDRVQDPMIVTAFLHALAHSSVLAGKYGEALQIIDRELDLIKRARLNFVLPHVLITRASASAGRRNFADASRNLMQAEQIGRDANDRFILSSAAVARIQILLAEGRLDRGHDAAGSAGVESSLPALRAELLATRALAAAAVGQVDDSELATSEAIALARSAEAREFCAWANCVRSLRASGPAEDVVKQFHESVHSGCVHAFVCAYRATPPILEILAPRDDARSNLQTILLRARDELLGRRAGLEVPIQQVADLSVREVEVFALLAQGVTNAEIAKRLFITEATAKVHVRRIFQKTGARTRAEAAVVAASYLSGRDQ